MKLNEKELLAKSKIKQTKRNKKFYSYLIINMELYIIIKRIVNCKKIIRTVSGRDPTIIVLLTASGMSSSPLTSALYPRVSGAPECNIH